jgi:uncharacterized protein YifE (UPF0438 family)
MGKYVWVRDGRRQEERDRERLWSKFEVQNQATKHVWLQVKV